MRVVGRNRELEVAIIFCVVLCAILFTIGCHVSSATSSPKPPARFQTTNATTVSSESRDLVDFIVVKDNKTNLSYIIIKGVGSDPVTVIQPETGAQSQAIVEALKSVTDELKESNRLAAVQAKLLERVLR
jgi:hypothetical protein